MLMFQLTTFLASPELHLVYGILPPLLKKRFDSSSTTSQNTIGQRIPAGQKSLRTVTSERFLIESSALRIPL